MLTARMLALALCAAAAATLAACAGGPKAEPPPGFSLAGHWKLDHAASTDPQQVIAHMRAEAEKLLARHGIQLESGGTRAGPGGGGRGGQAGQGGQGADAGQPGATEDYPPPPGGHAGPRPDVLKRSPMMHVLTKAIERGDYLTVRQSPDEFVLDYGTTVRSFTPGEHSVVSAEGGVADRISGWRGREYVVRDKAQLGPNVEEHYGLSSDGKQLVEKLRIGPAELPAVELTRVYDHTDEIAPRALPTND
jgi:hypothetical protein